MKNLERTRKNLSDQLSDLEEGSVQKLMITKLFRIFILISVGTLQLEGLIESQAKANDKLVFSASSLAPHINKIIVNYNKRNNENVEVSFASSGSLARQIDLGAPASIFISANRRWIDWLIKKKRVQENSVSEYISNRLVLARHDSARHISGKSPKDIFSSLNPKDRIGIGDPGHVPLGKYTKLSLKKIGLWDHYRARFTPMPSALATTRLLDLAAVPMAMIYKSDGLKRKNIKIIYQFSEKEKGRARYWIATIKSDKTPRGQALIDYLYSKDVMKSWQENGFMLSLDP